MHKLIDYICDELEGLEKKADDSKLTMSDVQYGDMLAHFKKNLLTAEAMMDADDEYSNSNSYRRDNYSMARRRGGRSREGLHDLSRNLREMERNAQDENSRRMIRKWMEQIEE